MRDGTHFGVWGGTAERLRRTLRRTGRVVLAHGDVATYDRATGDVQPSRGAGSGRKLTQVRSPYNDLVTSPDPSVISNLEALGITEAELDAMVNVSLERMNDLAHFAAMHRNPERRDPLRGVGWNSGAASADVAPHRPSRARPRRRGDVRSSYR